MGRKVSVEAREKALSEGLKTFVGEPCEKHPECSERWVSNYSCLKCVKETKQRFLAAHKGELAEKRRAWDRQNPVKAMLQRARLRAKRNGVEFSLEPSDVSIPETCPVLGLKLVRNGDIDLAPSLDRIDNSKGYVPGNVVVVSFRANRIKNNAELSELRKVLNFYDNL